MTKFKYNPGPFEPISDEEFKKRMGKISDELHTLYDIMPTLTQEEYRRRFKEALALTHDLGDNFVLLNTAWIEEREFEVYGKRWYEYE